MAEKKPSIHKTLLILILVFVPPYWLLFTDDGARMSDTALLWLLGEDEIKFNVKELSSGFTRDHIREVFSDISWQCSDRPSTFGDSLCAAQIGTFNGYPSRAITLFFREGRVSAMKLIYRDQYHEQVRGYYIAQLGQPDNVEAALAEGPDAADVLEWRLDNGVLMMKKVLGKTDEPSLLWVAAAP